MTAAENARISGVFRSKKRILLLNVAEIRRKTQVRQPYCNLYAYGVNNPVRYIDPDGKFLTRQFLAGLSQLTSGILEEVGAAGISAGTVGVGTGVEFFLDWMVFIIYLMDSQKHYLLVSILSMEG